MIKRDEIEDSQSCFNKAQDGERLFVMLARDPAAPGAIRAWITERIRLGKNKPDDDQIREAHECARRMEIERSEIDASRRQQQMRWAEDAVPRGLMISRFATKMHSLTRESLTWLQLAALLSEPRRTSCTVATCRGSSCTHKDGACWSPAVFRGSKRSAQDVEEVSCLALDVDHVTDAGVDALRSQLAEYQHLLHVTHADRPDDRCLRIVVQLSRAVTPMEWLRFWRAAVIALGLPANLACGDIARCYYLPSRPLDADYFAAVHTGGVFDVDAALAAAPILDDLGAQPAVVQEGISA